MVPLLVVLYTCVLGHSFIIGGDVAVSTHHPPYEQWLTGLGAGAGLSLVVWHLFMPPTHLTLPSPHCHHTVVW
jgi:hypothetical protein